MSSIVYNEDCMGLLKQTPDKYYDLCVCDPPYGIDIANMNMGAGKGKRASKLKNRKWNPKNWDSQPPNKEYFNELFRVSQNQIIWGANYFTQYLPSSMGWIFWDKGQDLSMSDGELAFSSYEKALRRVKINRGQLMVEGGTIHPTQKPIKLYDWLLKNYAKQGDKILDTHLGSQSSRIAAYKLGFDFWGTELDSKYFNDGNARFEQSISMPLFDSPKPILKQEVLF